MDGFKVKVFLANKKKFLGENISVGGGARRSSKGGYPIPYASLRDSRSFKEVLLNVGPKDLKCQDQDERALKDSRAGLIARRSKALGSDRVTTTVGGHVDDVEVKVVSVYPKPMVVNDAKWHISIKKEEMNWFRCSLVGTIKSMYNPEVVQTVLSADGFEVVVCPWYGMLTVIRAVISDTNMVLDGKMNRFVDPKRGDMDGFSISHGSRLHNVEVGLLNEGCQTGGSGLIKGGLYLAFENGLGSGCNKAGHLDNEVKSSRKGRGKKKSHEESTVRKTLQSNNPVTLLGPNQSKSSLEALEEAQATLVTGERLGIEFHASRGVVLNRLVTVEMKELERYRYGLFAFVL
ncbi:hypothetical protein V6N13_113136 [Hibiscus sabdariffa]